jgi:hypothetical protein
MKCKIINIQIIAPEPEAQVIIDSIHNWHHQVSSGRDILFVDTADADMDPPVVYKDLQRRPF